MNSMILTCHAHHQIATIAALLDMLGLPHDLGSEHIMTLEALVHLEGQTAHSRDGEPSPGCSCLESQYPPNHNPLLRFLPHWILSPNCYFLLPLLWQFKVSWVRIASWVRLGLTKVQMWFSQFGLTRDNSWFGLGQTNQWPKCPNNPRGLRLVLS